MKKTIAAISAVTLCFGSLSGFFSEAETNNILTASAESGIEINEENFPDDNFRAYVNEKLDQNKDSILSNTEINNINSIDIQNNNIHSLKGIQFFTLLESLNCNNNNLTTLDLSKNTALKFLNCSYNQLTSLDVSNKPQLQSLYCDNNKLTQLDISNNQKLEKLECHINNLSELDLNSNTELLILYCDRNQLETIDLSNNSLLTVLYCPGNKIKDIDLRKNINLNTLVISNNKLTSIDVSKNAALNSLQCSFNELTEIDTTLNSALTYLGCGSNQITGLDLSKNTALTTLDCFSNEISNLDLSHNTALERLDCKNNMLTTLDVSNNKELDYLWFDENMLTSIDISNNSEINFITYENNKYDIHHTDGTYDLSALPEGFDIKKASDWENAELNGSILTIKDYYKPITYKYECGYKEKVTFSLIPIFYLHINEDNFPDENFRNYIKENIDKDKNNLLHQSELMAVTQINLENKNISDLKGIEYFPSLKHLNCSNNNLEYINLNNNSKLYTLDCSFNKLEKLDISMNTQLHTLYCNSNSLLTLNTTNNTELVALNCSNNQIYDLDLFENRKLYSLKCASNRLENLFLSLNQALNEIDCSSNQLTSLNINNNPLLSTLNSADNYYPIQLLSSVYDLSELPGGFDVEKATDWTNAIVNDNSIRILFPKNNVTYNYDIGNGETATFTLKPVLTQLKEEMVSEIPDQLYTGKPIQPEVIIKKFGDIIPDTEYFVTYKNNTEVGTAQVIIDGIGVIIGEIIIEFEIIDPIIGDVDNNKTIDALDASAVLSEYATIVTGGKSQFSEVQVKAADINADGIISASDASLILDYYAYISAGGDMTIQDYINS